jgi:hypothetical protein
MTKKHILGIAKVHMRNFDIKTIYIYKNIYKEEWQISIDKPKEFKYGVIFKEYKVKKLKDINKISKEKAV